MTYRCILVFVLSLVLAFISASSRASPRDSTDSWHQRVVEVSSGDTLRWESFVETLTRADIVVLGETHNNKGVQEAESAIIRGVVDASRVGSDFALGWEFLDWTLQSEITKAFNQLRFKKISPLDFLKLMRLGKSNRTYIPVLEAVSSRGGDLLALNLSRAQKSPITVGGLKALDPRLIPPSYERGDEGYWNRFQESMGGHASDQLIDNYYEAQCLTDDTMAYSLALSPSKKIKFVIVGHFHADYSSGVVERLRKRHKSGTKIAVVRIDDASNAEVGEWHDLLRPHPKYGSVSDFIYFVGEPKRSK